MNTLDQFITGIPKAELHLHIEGTFEPELMFEIAHRNGVVLPFDSVEELRAAYKFDCLQDFLDIYYTGANVLLEERDFYDLTMAYLRRCQAENIVHAEIMFDPQTHTSRGVPFDTVILGILRACKTAGEEWGMSTELIMSFLRHLSEEEAFVTLSQSLPYKEKIKAVGLDSSEMGNPPSKFEAVFRAAAAEGYVLLAHAGEEGPPEYIWEAIDVLHIARIDHGNRCLEDEALVQEIVSRDIALTLCPLSNVALKVVSDLRDHPLRQMLAKGLKATINSDDPAYFGGYLNQNIQATADALGLEDKEITQLVQNSFRYSLLDEVAKQSYLDKVQSFVGSFDGVSA